MKKLPLVLSFCLIAGCATCPDKNGSSAAYPSKQDLKYPHYNLILISMGNIGTRHMSLYGYERKTTPLLEEWAKEAVVFTNTYSPASWTPPVATSLFTSLQPYSHRVMFKKVKLDERIKPLAQLLKDKGYRTAAFTGEIDYSIQFGHMRGFDDFIENQRFASFKKTLSESTEWLNKHSNDSFFLFVHGYDAHCPYKPPDEFRGIFSSTEGKNITVDPSQCVCRIQNSKDGLFVGYVDIKKEFVNLSLTQDDKEYLEGLYDESVLYTDYLIGNFLKSLGAPLLKKTIIVITADHGEIFDKNGCFGRPACARGVLYDDVINVPLLIRFPDGLHKRVSGLAQTIDIMPTVLQILGVPVPEYAQGKDLASLIRGGAEINKYIFAGTNYLATTYYKYESSSQCIRSKEWKLIFEERRQVDNPKAEPERRFELYNLAADPQETKNIFDASPDMAGRLKKELRRWFTACKKFKIHNTFLLKDPEPLIEELKSRGYW